MKKEKYDDEILTQYLLGSLDEEETERLDELSFTNDDVAERLQAIENDLVDGYVRGELSGPALERFNSYYLSSPARREKTAFARGLQSFLGRAAVTEQAEKTERPRAGPSSAGEPDLRKGSLGRYFFLPRLGLQWGLAAALLIVLVAGVWLSFENLRLRNQVEQALSEGKAIEERERQLETDLAQRRSSDAKKDQELESLRDEIARLEQRPIEQQGATPAQPTEAEPNIAPFVLRPQTRGVSQIPQISIPAGADYVMIKLELEPGDFTFYRAELRTQPGNASVWKSGRLRAKAGNAGKAITLTLRPALLESQTYSLELYGISPTGAAEIISNYPFRVAKQ